MSITNASLRSRLTPYFITSALQDFEINSFSWIGLNAKSDTDIFAQLAQTQYNSLQNLQLVFSDGHCSKRKRKDPSTLRASDTEHPYPVFQKLSSLSLSNVDLSKMGSELIEKLNILCLSRLRIVGCPGTGELLEHLGHYQQLVPKLQTFELEMSYSSAEALQRVLCRFETLEDFRLQVHGPKGSAGELDIFGLGKHTNLRRFSCEAEVAFSDMGLLRPLENHKISLSYLGTSTKMECLSLSCCSAALVSKYRESDIE